MSGIRESTACRSPNPPLAPLRLILLCQIMSSEAERVLPSPARKKQKCRPALLFVFAALRAFLRYDFAVRSESNDCSRATSRVGLSPSPAPQSRSAAGTSACLRSPPGFAYSAGPFSRLARRTFGFPEAS